MNAMTKDEFIREFQEILGPTTMTIHGDEALENLRGWDSMAKVMFLAMADEMLGRTVSAMELAACKTVGDLIALFPGKIS